MSRRRRAGIIGGALGLVAAGTAVGLAAQRYAIGRIRTGEPSAGEPGAGEPSAGERSAGQPGAGQPGAGEPFDRLPADRRSVVVADDGVPLYVEETGPLDAPVAIVFVHGYSLRMGSWHFQRRDLPHRVSGPLRMVFFDLRSHGRSGRGPENASTIEQLGDDLAAVLRHVGDTAPIVLVGHSMGGMAAMALTAQNPELVAGLAGVVLIATSAGRGGASFGLPGPLAPIGPPVQRMAVAGLRAQPALIGRAVRIGRDVSWLIVRRLSFGSREVSPAVVSYAERMITSTPADVIAAFLPVFGGYDKRDALAALRDLPVLIIVGDADRMTPPAHSEEMARALPDAQLVVLPGAGHLVMLEAADDVTGALAEFVDATATRTARRVVRRRKRTT
ncbi:MAG: alpha/beta fold hydrolase [Mycobacteriales bacterium]|nr:MAG: alpha/beta hydrolase [Pseudonocardiales bacterium]